MSALSPAIRLAEQVLSMGLITPRGIVARRLAREVIDGNADLLHALRLIQHATAPQPDDGGHHEAAYEIASAAIATEEKRERAAGFPWGEVDE